MSNCHASVIENEKEEVRVQLFGHVKMVWRFQIDLFTLVDCWPYDRTQLYEESFFRYKKMRRYSKFAEPEATKQSTSALLKACVVFAYK